MEITVGIDVSKAGLDVHVHPLGESFAVGNDEAGVAGLVERLGRLDGLASIGIEASGRYERLAVAELANVGLPVVVLNPAQVRHYGRAIGLRAKTDPIDARLIALFVEAVRPEPRPMPEQQTQDLAALMARRRQIVACGKPKLVALIATARKLLTILNAILRDAKPWRPA